MEAIFGHHGTQDLGDRFGRFGFQAHGAVNGNQVQSESRQRTEVNIMTSLKKRKKTKYGILID